MTYEELVSFVEKNLKKAEAKKIEEHIAVEFDVYGEGEGAFYVEVNEGEISALPYEYYDRDAKVFITAEELVKIINNEKTPQESFEEGILMIEGNIDAASKLITLIKAPEKKTAAKKPAAKKTAAKKSTAAKTVDAEKKIVKETKKKDSKVAKDIKK